MPGPLEGLRVVEMVGIGPAPFAAMLFADMGAEVIRVDRPLGQAVAGSGGPGAQFDVAARSRRSLAIDLKIAEGRDTVLELIDRADVLIEGFRPGVMERLGVGPEVCLRRQPKLVYGRMTGWGQYGPLKHAAGHDINYIALTGALHAIGRAGQPPTVPLNYVGDYGGGAMVLAFGVLCAITAVRAGGPGQIVDAAMTDGAALLSAAMFGLRAAGRWSEERGANLLDGGAHFYGTYACADGKFVAIGPLEPQFYALLLRLLGIEDLLFVEQMDVAAWPMLRTRLADVFTTRTRAEWCSLLEGTDACFAPVLDWDEAPLHPHNLARGTFVDVGGVIQPAPAPRFSQTPAAAPRPAALPGADSEAVLADWGVSAARIAQLRSVGAV